MSTRELVDALISGDSINIDNSFNNAIAQKLSNALDAYRVEVAKSIYPKSEVETTTDDNSIEA